MANKKAGKHMKGLGCPALLLPVCLSSSARGKWRGRIPASGCQSSVLVADGYSGIFNHPSTSPSSITL